MKIDRDLYETINYILADLDYNLIVLKSFTEKETAEDFTEEERNYINLGRLLGYLEALDTMEISYHLLPDGMYQINPENVENV